MSPESPQRDLSREPEPPGAPDAGRGRVTFLEWLPAAGAVLFAVLMVVIFAVLLKSERDDRPAFLTPDRSLSSFASLAAEANDEVALRAGTRPVVSSGDTSFTVIDEDPVSRAEMNGLYAAVGLRKGSGACSAVIAGDYYPQRLKVCAPKGIEGELRIIIAE